MGSLLLLAPRAPQTADGAPSWRAERFDVPRRLDRGLITLAELDDREDARALHAVLAGHLAALLSHGTVSHGTGLARPEPLTLELAGPRLLAALLVPRAHDVFAAGAAPWPADAVEHVHALRVATRRLREALALAAPLVPRRAYRRANVRAREIGRILGARRTIDVLKEDLTAHFAEEGLTAGHTPTFLARLDALGDAAMATITRELPPERFLRDGMKVLELVVRAKDDATSLGALAGPHLAARVAAVDALVAIIDVPHEVEQHHELRIALKHLRYAAEILREVMPERIDAEETITPIKKVQDALGLLNDAQELAALARDHRAEAPALPDGGLRALDALVEDLGALAKTRYEAARAAVHAIVPGVSARLGAVL